MSFLSVDNDSITLEEVKSSLYSREFLVKTFGNGDEVFASGLSMIDSTKRQKMKKDKGGKKSKIDPKDICNYCKKFKQSKEHSL